MSEFAYGFTFGVATTIVTAVMSAGVSLYMVINDAKKPRSPSK